VNLGLLSACARQIRFISEPSSGACAHDRPPTAKDRAAVRALDAPLIIAEVRDSYATQLNSLRIASSARMRSQFSGK